MIFPARDSKDAHGVPTAQRNERTNLSLLKLSAGYAIMIGSVLATFTLCMTAPNAPAYSLNDLAKQSNVQKLLPAGSRLPQCNARKTFALGDTPDTILMHALRPMVLAQDAVPIEDLSTVISVPASGVIDVTLKLETKHRGDGYSEVVGIGAYMSYQYASTRAGLVDAPVVQPVGWAAGTNIRDLRDHYGQINIVSALAVKPGYYRICLFATAHSALSKSNRIAEILVEGGISPLNTLRLSYQPGGRLLN